MRFMAMIGADDGMKKEKSTKSKKPKDEKNKLKGVKALTGK